MGDFGPTGDVRRYIQQDQYGGIVKFDKIPTTKESADANQFIPDNKEPIKPLTHRQGASTVVIKPSKPIGQSMENVVQPFNPELTELQKRVEQDRMMKGQALKTAIKVKSRGVMEALGDFLDKQLEKDRLELAVKTAGMTAAMAKEEELKNLAKWRQQVETYGDPNKARSKLQELALEGLTGIDRMDATEMLDKEVLMFKQGQNSMMPEGEEVPRSYDENIAGAEERVAERERAAQEDMDEAEGFRNDIDAEASARGQYSGDIYNQDDEFQYDARGAAAAAGGDTPYQEMRMRAGEEELPSESQVIPEWMGASAVFHEEDAGAQFQTELGVLEKHGGTRETTTFGKVGGMDYEEKTRNINRVDGAGFGNQGISRAGFGTGGGGGGGAEGGGGPMATAQREEAKRGRPKKRISGAVMNKVRKMIEQGSPIRTIAREVGGLTEYQVRQIRDRMQVRQRL